MSGHPLYHVKVEAGRLAGNWAATGWTGSRSKLQAMTGDKWVGEGQGTVGRRTKKSRMWV